MKATAEQLRGNLGGFKKAVRRRDIEIERLRTLYEDEHKEVLRLSQSNWRLLEDREAVIEECAKVLDSFAAVQSNPDFQAMYEDAAAAIRALKDKP